MEEPKDKWKDLIVVNVGGEIVAAQPQKESGQEENISRKDERAGSHAERNIDDNLHATDMPKLKIAVAHHEFWR
jgi:hypothetical protein